MCNSRCLLAIVALATTVGSANPAVSEIFRWTDAGGKLHFAQDILAVPARYRREAGANAESSRTNNRIQTYHPASPALARLRTTAGGDRRHRSYRIPVQRAGTMLLVTVRLNDELEAPFYIDTGASDVSVPRWMIEELGIDLAGARTSVYGTANGTIENALLTLDSVSLGGARVDQVPASVSDSMKVGLLGLSYFNHFNYNVDPQRGVVTLVENDLKDTGLIRGGRSQAQWRLQFGAIERRRDAVGSEIERTPRSHGREHRRLEGALDEVDRQREILEDEADDAHVPFSWRD